MTPRSIRRAAQRKAMKAARKAERLTSLRTDPPQFEDEERETTAMPTEAICYNPEPSEDTSAEPLLFTPSPLSPAQLAANRANSQLSCGPTSPEGKAKSSLNAVKTGLTGRTVLLPADDAREYERHLRAYTEEFSPVGQRESDLVQSIADTMWRLKRIPCLENAIFAQGHMEFAEAFNQHDAPLRSGMIEVQTFIKYEKQLRNLQLQESRLARRREKEMAELRQLQHARQPSDARLAQETNSAGLAKPSRSALPGGCLEGRRSKEREALETASRLYLAAKETNQSFDSAANGFVFSTAQIEQHLASVRARNLSRTGLERSAKQAA